MPEMQPCWSKDGVVLTRDATTGIFCLLLDRGENVFHPTLVELLSQALQLVEKAEHPKALIITGKGKFFSNGLDLHYLQNSATRAQHAALIEQVWRWLARLLILDCRTVAAINGHAFGAGLFVALAADYRVMRRERGYLCWPEVNLGMRLAKGFAELSKAKVSNAAVLRDGVLTGKRYTAQQALQDGLIDQVVVAQQDLPSAAWAMAAAGLPANLDLQNFNPHSLVQMKMELYTDAYRALSMASAHDDPASRL